MFSIVKSELGDIRTYKDNGEKWFVAKDILMDAIGYRNITDALDKVDRAEIDTIQMPRGYKYVVLTSEGLKQFFTRTNSRKEEFKIMKLWAVKQGFIPKEVDKSVATKLPALGEAFNNSEFGKLEVLKVESKQARSYSLEGNFCDSITKSYVNGLLLLQDYGFWLSLLLVKPSNRWFYGVGFTDDFLKVNTF
ncbi:BRO family protein [Bacillus mycoides]|uniref:BRO family protein n=1 Tax=Bacillus mycoides TaxID=1405 RepID=UPI002E1F9926|nr:BRO family protein [Bacillus mycoides]